MIKYERYLGKIQGFSKQTVANRPSCWCTLELFLYEASFCNYASVYVKLAAKDKDKNMGNLILVLLTRLMNIEKSIIDGQKLLEPSGVNTL